MITLRCPVSLVVDTLQALSGAGNFGNESVVLWLAATDSAQPYIVTRIYVPVHEADHDWFYIPAKSMRSLLEHLRATRTKLVAQIHSHPKEAFHSFADNEWAIVRHKGALSIVVPYFAATSTANNFIETSKAFQLDESDRWLEVEPKAVFEIVR